LKKSTVEIMTDSILNIKPNLIMENPTKQEIEEALNEAYKKAGCSVNFGEGFLAGIEFLLKRNVCDYCKEPMNDTTCHDCLESLDLYNKI